LPLSPERAGLVGGINLPRNSNWKTETTFQQRRIDWENHDKIVDFLAKFQNWNKASQQEDYEGIDIWYGSIPFDVKYTIGYPKTCVQNLFDFDLFLWYLEHQDLDRFHNTNRIIILQKSDGMELDLFSVACDIQSKIEMGNYFKNIKYQLRGRIGQDQHQKIGTFYSMPIGLLVTI